MIILTSSFLQAAGGYNTLSLLSRIIRSLAPAPADLTSNTMTEQEKYYKRLNDKFDLEESNKEAKKEAKEQDIYLFGAMAFVVILGIIIVVLVNN